MYFQSKSISTFAVISLFVLLPNLGFTQNIEFIKENFPDKKSEFKAAKKNYKAGNYLYLLKKYDEALKHYLIANEFNPQHAVLNYKIGKCYLNSPNKTKSLPFFEKVNSLNPNVYIEFHYSLGYAYQINSEWDKAISEYKKFLDAYSTNTQKDDVVESESITINSEQIIEDANKKIGECKTGKWLLENPVNVEIENLGKTVNSEYTDYGPTISADESVLMFTSRREGTTDETYAEHLNEYFEDIYITYNENGKWTESKNIGIPVNTARHDAIVGLSFDGQKLFIYRDDERANGDIYVSKLTGEQWSKPNKLTEPINTEFHESSACLSYDGKTLYFISNRPGGFGGRDIYVCKWDNNSKKWSELKNLGNTINTKYNEGTVYIHPDGKTLYFCSQGHNTMGGYDIFKSVKQNGRWSKPENLGYPINSPDDDVFFVVSANGKHAYYASVKKNGYGKRDIYRVTFAEVKVQPQLTILKGIITEAPPEEENFLKGRFIYQLLPFDKTLGLKIDLLNDQGEVIYTSVTDKEGFFEFRNLPWNQSYIIRVDNQNPDLILQLFDKNGDVLAKWANNTSGEFIYKHLPHFSSPVAAQIEIIDLEKNEVIANFESNSTTGKYLVSLPAGKNYGIVVKTDGYLFHSEHVNIPASYGYQEITKDIKLNKISVGKKMVLNNIFFDYDKATLRTESTAELNRLVNLMNEESTLKIEIAGHTDNKGSNAYNQKLSENRSKAVVDYLIANDIRKDRLMYKGYGEIMPIASNKTEDGRQLNRRIEFKILSK